MLNQQLAVKNSQIKEKDEQLKLMQKLLSQSQQLQLMAKKIEKLKDNTSNPNMPNSTILNGTRDLKEKDNPWWHFW